MQALKAVHSKLGLSDQGIENVNVVYWNLAAPLLYEEAIRRREGRVASLGQLVVRTGQHTGRSPNDKYIVRDRSSRDKVWWGKVNKEMSSDNFSTLKRRLLNYLHGKDLFVQDCFVGADPACRLPIRVITETAWHNLFARTMFIPATVEQLSMHVPEFTVIHAPNFHAVPDLDKTHSEVFIVISFEERTILIGGTHYAGEIKKAIFTVLNYLLPQKSILSMHSSVNVGSKGDVAIFFGLSGTGKTSLSADSSRRLIGDDEHGWGDTGVFNFEGGCYAKAIKLTPESEPEIYRATQMFGTILENVTMDSLTGELDLDDATLTENTRAAYPIKYISNSDPTGITGHPSNIIMLTADAFGVLPPIAKLTSAQAMYYFLSGYTAKVAGTESGIKEPQATFSSCFGAPFMPLQPTVYANMLRAKIEKHYVKVWLINTGWSGGPYGTGERINIGYTRAMINAALEGKLDNIEMLTDPTFNLAVPASCPDIPSQILNTRNTWDDKTAYDSQAQRLAAMFNENFEQFVSKVPLDVKSSGPNT
jgi:phosphoenolpyruvate carboxykinase (ATP)